MWTRATGGASIRLWTLYREPHLARCELTSTSSSLELRTFINGTMLVSWQVPSEAEAVRRAATDRTELLADGWWPVDDVGTD